MKKTHNTLCNLYSIYKASLGWYAELRQPYWREPLIQLIARQSNIITLWNDHTSVECQFILVIFKELWFGMSVFRFCLLNTDCKFIEVFSGSQNELQCSSLKFCANYYCLFLGKVCRKDHVVVELRPRIQYFSENMCCLWLAIDVVNPCRWIFFRVLLVFLIQILLC